MAETKLLYSWTRLEHPRVCNDLVTRKYWDLQVPKNTNLQITCVNVPLPPQSYDPFNPSKRKRRSSKKIQKIPLEYPKPAVPNKYHYLYIGANKTLISWQFYIKIPWYSYEMATKFLAEYIFEVDLLSTHSVYGKQQLDRSIVEDIINHVAARCNVGEEYVIFAIAKLCAYVARLKRYGYLHVDFDPYPDNITY